MTNLFFLAICGLFIETGPTCTTLGPITHVIDAFFHLIREWNDFVTASHDAIGIDIFFGFEGIEQGGNKCLLDF